MKELALYALVLAALLAAAVLAGYAWHDSRDQAAISAAQSDAAVCRSALAGNQGALADVRTKLADLQRRHDAALAAATKALDARDAETLAQRASAEARSNAIRNAAHADADCAALDRLPVCARIAGQLWPRGAAAAAGAHAH